VFEQVHAVEVNSASSSHIFLQHLNSTLIQLRRYSPLPLHSPTRLTVVCYWSNWFESLSGYQLFWQSFFQYLGPNAEIVPSNNLWPFPVRSSPFISLHTDSEVDKTYLVPYSGVLLGKLLVSHLVKNLFAFYGTRMVINVFTTARHVPLFSTRRVQSTPCNYISLRSALILSSHLRLSYTWFVYLRVFWLHVFMNF
jgi:hypothetical protein